MAIVSDVDTHYQKEESEKSKKGLMGSGGGIGFTVGKKKEQVEADNTKERAARSQVGSLKGNTLISTEGHYQQTGSVVTSRDGDVDIFAKSAKVEAARSEYESNYKRTVEQKGVTIAVNIPAVQAVQAAEKVVKTTQKAGESKNNRINAMSSINSAWDAMRLGDQVLGMMDNIKKASSLAQGLSQGVSVSVTYGQQKQVQTQHSIGAKGESSQINAGGKVNLRAIGEGDKSTITVIGSDIGGKQGTSLKADGNIDLLAFQQKHQDRSTNKSSGFNAGIAASYGQGTFAFGATAGANYGKGYGNGDESTWLHSHVGHKDSLTSIESGQDINMKGGQARGNRIEFSAENLNMESLQDTMKYRSKQMNAEGSATVGYGFSANGSYNQSKMNADFANVNEQTGVFAGDRGYSVNIRKHTDLKGATITSTEKAEMLGNNQFGTDTLTHQDIQNQSSYSAKGFGLDGGFSVGGGKSPQKIGDMELQQIGNNHKDGSSKVELNGIAGVASQGKPFTSVQSELTYTVFERLRAGLDMPRIFGASNASMVALLYTEYV